LEQSLAHRVGGLSGLIAMRFSFQRPGGCEMRTHFSAIQCSTTVRTWMTY
jgi:hypothetical protein